MKKIIKNKYFIIAIALFLLGSTVFVAVKVRQNSQKKSEEKKQEEQKKEEETGGKFNETTESQTTNNTQNNIQSSGSTNSSGNTSQPGVLTNVSLTVYLDNDTGGVNPYFYMPQGVYTVQKMVSGTWQNVATNINYVGHGGLNVAKTSPEEDNISYRVLKIENGAPSQISKTFVVRRGDMVGGVKTYN